MEIKQIRMGIVGAGTWGRTHASIYAEHLFADPVAICDMNEARAREIADEFGIRKVYTDYHDMAADEEIDAALTALDGGSYGAILRAKGIVPAVDGGWIHFDYVPFEHNVRRGSAEVTGRLCVIGAELKEDEVSALFHI